MTIYDSSVVSANIGGINYKIPYTGTVPSASPDTSSFTSYQQGIIQGWWNNQDQTSWQQAPDSVPAPEPDWAGLRADLLDSATISVWFDSLSAIHREDITAQIQGQDTATLADAVVRVDYAAVKDEINGYLSSRNIEIQLP